MLFSFQLTVTRRAILNKTLSFLSGTKTGTEQSSKNQTPTNNSQLEAVVFSAEGVELPIIWSDLGKKLIKSGIIDKEKFEGVTQMDLNKDYEKLEGFIRKNKIRCIVMEG